MVSKGLCTMEYAVRTRCSLPLLALETLIVVAMSFEERLDLPVV